MKVRHLGLVHVKCSRFLEVSEAVVSGTGFLGDREFVLVNHNNELLGPAEHGPFIALQFSYSRESRLLTLQLPEGKRISERVCLADEVECVDYLGMRNLALRKVLGAWDERLSEHSGKDVRLFRCELLGEGVDILPITLVTTGSLQKLSQVTGQVVDHRRFRANIVIEHDFPHAEDDWEGQILCIGDTQLRIRSSVPRCLVTQLDPETGENDLRLVPKLATYRDRVGIPDGLLPNYRTPGFASYAEVVTPGILRVGDAVTLEGYDRLTPEPKAASLTSVSSL